MFRELVFDLHVTARVIHIINFWAPEANFYRINLKLEPILYIVSICKDFMLIIESVSVWALR